jgi:hypothetical protein
LQQIYIELTSYAADTGFFERWLTVYEFKLLSISIKLNHQFELALVTNKAQSANAV